MKSKWKQNHPLYHTWTNMRRRCGLVKGANETERKNYLPKNLEIEPEWADRFAPFETWALLSGWKPGMWICRNDVDKGYTKDNIYFGSQYESVNRRKINLRTSDGLTLRDAATKAGVKLSRSSHVRISGLVNAGYASVDDALTKYRKIEEGRDGAE